MMDMNESSSKSTLNDALTEKVIGCAIKIHRVLGPGFLETIYHQALAYELGKSGISYVNEARMQVKYEGIILGDYIADFLIEKRVVVENKTVESLNKSHEVQLVNYLSAVRFDVGLIINFGGEKIHVKRKCREYRAQGKNTSLLHVVHVPPV